jgi:VPDSG-CTERM motif
LLKVGIRIVLDLTLIIEIKRFKYMKKIYVISLLVGICGYAEATNINSGISGQNSLLGTDAYEWGISSTTKSSQSTSAIYVPTGDYLASVTINISGITLTSESTGWLYVDLLNGALPGGNKTGVAVINDSDAPKDYFSTVKYASSKYSADLVNLKSQPFAQNKTQNLSIGITGTAFTLLTDSILDYGYFDIGLDPDCYYDVSSIYLTYTVAPITPNVTPTPDASTTVLLLGAGLLGLEVFRRRFNLAPVK